MTLALAYLATTSAYASSWPATNLSMRLADVEFAVLARVKLSPIAPTVLDGGIPVYDVQVEALSCLRSAPGLACPEVSSVIRLSPRVVSDIESFAGQRVVVLVRVMADGNLVMYGGPGAVYREVEERLVDANGDPVVDIDCIRSPLIARPTDQQPVADSASEGPVGAPLRLFTDEPLQHGMLFDDFVSIIGACDPLPWRETMINESTGGNP